VDVDEQWLTSRGRWPYGFVVFEVPTELPVLGPLRPSRSQWACRWLGAPRRQLKTLPRVLITDGLPASAALVPGAKPVWCRLHHQQGVTHGLPQHCKTEAEMNLRKPRMQKVLPSRDQRTGRRRRARLRARAAEWGLTPWVRRMDAQWPGLICTVGRVRLPSTTKASERFCRACERFDNTRQGFPSVLSATRELRLLLVVDRFTQHATTGQAPMEVIVPEARSMPLYRLSHDPFRALQERADVKPAASLADCLTPQAAAA
jgi:hypothetical protein